MAKSNLKTNLIAKITDCYNKQTKTNQQQKCVGNKPLPCSLVELSVRFGNSTNANKYRWLFSFAMYFYVHCFPFHNASGKNDLPGVARTLSCARAIYYYLIRCECVCFAEKVFSSLSCFVCKPNACENRFGIYSYMPDHCGEDSTEPCFLLHFSLFTKLIT